MMLRSSSTPVLGSLLSSSFTDSPNHPEVCHAIKHLPPTSAHHKLSLHQTGSLNLFCTSPISPSISDLNKGFRRVQSDGNLQDLAYSSSCNNSSNNNNEDRLFNYTTDPLPPKRFSARQRCLALETIPSFNLSRHKGLRVEEEDEESDFEDDWEERGDLEEEELKSGSGMNMILRTEEVRVKDGVCRVGFGDNMEGVGGGGNKGMYLAKGLGVDVCGDGMGGCRGNGGGGGYGYGGGDSNSMNDGDGNNNHDGVEEYYKKMVEENPGNPLFLRNYAQFLYQYKQDREGAEEYYSRAILADPKDGEVLSQYGKLVWEVHHDQQRASTYFERAVQASPQDSHVHAAYACFLWDTEEDEDGCNEPQCLPNHFHLGAMATTTAGV